MKKTGCGATAGFLLLSLLLVLAMLLSTVVLSLTTSRWLWKAGQAEMIDSELRNSQQGALHEVKQLIALQQVPATCWHHSVAPSLSAALFEKNPTLGCRVANSTSFYWLERLIVVHPDNTPIAYHLTLITQKHQQRLVTTYFGFAFISMPTEKPLISF